METATDKLLFGTKDGYIPEGTKILGEESLAYKDLINSGITIPNSVTELEDFAFCNSKLPMTTFIIPNSVTKIGRSAFLYCGGMQGVTLSNNLKYISFRAFSDCGSLQEISVPDSVTMIEEEAFAECNLLDAVNFGANVRYIAKKHLAVVLVGNPEFNTELRVIASLAFESCREIDTLTLGETC